MIQLDLTGIAVARACAAKARKTDSVIDDSTEQVIREIFGEHSGWADGQLHDLKRCPGFDDIAALAALLADEPLEEGLQCFLQDRPQFLLGLFGAGDDADLAFLTKPPVGTSYRADFAILNVGQGGCSVSLVEIERSSHPLFTNKGTPSRFLQTALGQVSDWHQWITNHTETFVSDILRLAKSARLHSSSVHGGSFRFQSPEGIEQSWRAFGGFDDPIIRFGIVIGRWSKLSEEHRKRLTYTNRHSRPMQTIFTYDQLARKAYDRPTRFP